MTIPKPLREKLGLTTATEVEFVEKHGELILQKKLSGDFRKRRANIRECVGVLEGQPEDVNQFIEDIRDR